MEECELFPQTTSIHCFTECYKNSHINGKQLGTPAWNPKEDENVCIRVGGGGGGGNFGTIKGRRKSP